MEAFQAHTGLVAPLERANVNTDDITPARFLKTVRRTGFASALFANWRYLADGSPNPDFVLNQSRYQGASVLLTRENFGCGSSREHAPWAIREYGFRCLIAPGFADIFYNNCFNSSILPITLKEVEIAQLFRDVAAMDGYRLHVDLSSQRLTTPTGATFRFEIDPFRKQSLLKGLDAIGWTLSHQSAIETYIEQRRQQTPWLFQSMGRSEA